MRPLLLAAMLTVTAHRGAHADFITSLVGGDPITVQFGSIGSPTAFFGPSGGFDISNGFNWPLPGAPQVPPQHFTYDYAAAPFEAATLGYPIEIGTFRFFHNFPVTVLTNVFNVFMSTGGGPLSFFGQFGYFGPGFFAGTLLPGGAGGFGSYLYDPRQGDLHIEMIQTADMAASSQPFTWWHDKYTPNGPTGLVTRFDGAIVAPEPSTFVLLGTGLLIAAGAARRRRS